MVPGSTLKVFKGAPHGMCTTIKDEINADLLEFIATRAEKKVEKRKAGPTPDARTPEAQL